MKKLYYYFGLAALVGGVFCFVAWGDKEEVVVPKVKKYNDAWLLKVSNIMQQYHFLCRTKDARMPEWVKMEEDYAFVMQTYERKEGVFDDIEVRLAVRGSRAIYTARGYHEISMLMRYMKPVATVRSFHSVCVPFLWGISEAQCNHFYDLIPEDWSYRGYESKDGMLPENFMCECDFTPFCQSSYVIEN